MFTSYGARLFILCVNIKISTNFYVVFLSNTKICSIFVPLNERDKVNGRRNEDN